MPGALNGTPPMDVFGIEDCHGSSLNAGLVSAVVIGLSNSLSFPLQVVSNAVCSTLTSPRDCQGILSMSLPLLT